MLTDVNGSGYDNYDYLPFGERMSGGTGTTHYFTGDERDTETGLDHTLFRQYTSTVGRWNSPDPLAGDISDPQSLNRYAYVENDAVDFVDPLGAQSNSPGSSPCPQTSVSCSTLRNPPGGIIVGNAVGGGGAAGGGGDMYPLILIGDFDQIGPAPGKESFNSCMTGNAKNASIAGIFDALTFQKTDVKDNKVVSFVAGNAVADFYAGVLAGGKEAPTGALTYIPDLTKKAMGSTLTAGRRTTDLISLNLAGKGGVPKALGSATTGAKSFLGEIGDLVNLGMKFSTRIAIDAGLFNMEAMGCGIAQLSKQ